MHEQVFAFFRCDEAITLGVVEPLYCAISHDSFLTNLSLQTNVTSCYYE